jgi:hypothetical protein
MKMTYEKMLSYADGHCAGWMGWPCPVFSNQVDQQAADRGYWEGSKKREKILYGK